MKTILITGINGFLGSHLAKHLSRDYKIVGLEYTVENLFRLVGYDFKVYSSAEDPEKIFVENEIYAVVHAATVYRRSDEPIEKLINSNIILPVTLFNLANKHKSSMFLNTDSFFNNPEFDYKYLMDYTLSKKQVIEWLKIMPGDCRLFNMKIYHMYGKNDAPSKFIPKIISDLRDNVESIDLTPGEQKRDFIYVDDVVKAYEYVLKGDVPANEGMAEFQIGMGNSVSIKDLILLIKKVTGSTTELKFGALAYRDNEILDSVANNESLRSIGWTPDYDLENGLKQVSLD